MSVRVKQAMAQPAAQQAASASNVTVKELLDWLMPRLDEAGRTEMLQAQVGQCSSLQRSRLLAAHSADATGLLETRNAAVRCTSDACAGSQILACRTVCRSLPSASSVSVCLGVQAEYRRTAASDPGAKGVLIKRIHQIGGRENILRFHTFKNAGAQHHAARTGANHINTAGRVASLPCVI